MLNSIITWFRELKAEAPWYFWAYVVLTPMSCAMFVDTMDMYMSLGFLCIYVFLLKKWHLLGMKHIYIMPFIAIIFFLISFEIIFNIWFSTYLSHKVHYMFAQYCLIFSLSVFICVADSLYILIAKRKIILALQSGICTLFMGLSSTMSIILIWGILDFIVHN